ncbi:MAG TPA: hypothetical protein VFJ90_15160 [Candidatus Didemnitutus sp.]|nr:hypothetical protein [Candidatus Didemnitutus sp.]
MNSVTRSLLPAVIGALFVLQTGCTSLQTTSSAPAASQPAPAHPAETAGQIPPDAKAFMDAYAKDLKAGNRDSIIARYHSQGVFILAVGVDDLMRPRQIADFYRTQWQPPHAIAWRNLRYRSLSPETILIEGGFDWQQTADKPAQYFSYGAILIKEPTGFHIRSEIEFPQAPAS